MYNIYGHANCARGSKEVCMTVKGRVITSFHVLKK